MEMYFIYLCFDLVASNMPNFGCRFDKERPHICCVCRHPKLVAENLCHPDLPRNTSRFLYQNDG